MHHRTERTRVCVWPTAATVRCAAVALLALAGLSGCGKTGPVEPTTTVLPAPPGGASSPVPLTAGATDPSVPDAAAVLPAFAPHPTTDTQSPSNSALTAAQESTAMPLPGQNNDHSLPRPAASRASGH